MPLAVLLILALAQPAPRPGSLPDLPRVNVDNFLPAIRQQVEKVYAAAKASPNDAEANGQLGMILDAYEQYDAAETAYQRAHRLDPGSFRWLYLLGWVQEAQGRHEKAAASLGNAVWLKMDDLPSRHLRTYESTQCLIALLSATSCH